MMRKTMMRKIAPAILLISCLVLAGIAFRNMQSRSQDSRLQQSFDPDPGAGGLFSGIPASPAERAGAIRSISAQLNDFRRDDYVHAAYYQSPLLQDSVGSPEHFRTMITTAYPEFAQCLRIRYGGALSQMGGTRVNVPVTVTGKDGITVKAVYIMNRSPDGVYRVAGVEVAPPFVPDGVRSPFP